MAFHRHLPPPTAAERARWSRIKDSGCIACIQLGFRGVYAEIHHLTITGRHGGKARGHRETIGLCLWHHRGQYLIPDGAAQLRIYGPSLALTPRAFRERFGNDEFLLNLQDDEINEPRHDAAQP